MSVLDVSLNTKLNLKHSPSLTDVYKVTHVPVFKWFSWAVTDVNVGSMILHTSDRSPIPEEAQGEAGQGSEHLI